MIVDQQRTSDMNAFPATVVIEKWSLEIGHKKQACRLENWPETFNDVLGIRACHHVIKTEVTLTIATLVRQKVPAVCTPVLGLATRCDFEPLEHSLVGLLFSHNSSQL